jgi:hypothetical protein
VAQCFLDVAIDGEKNAYKRHRSSRAFDARTDAGHDLRGRPFVELASVGCRFALAPKLADIVTPFVFSRLERLDAGADYVLYTVEITGCERDARSTARRRWQP